MARTIGKENLRKVRELVIEAEKSGLEGCDEIFDYVREKLPLEVFEIWEMAWQEIKNEVYDYVMEGSFGKR